MPESWNFVLINVVTQFLNPGRKFREIVRADVILREETEVENAALKVLFHVVAMPTVTCFNELTKVTMCVEWIKIFLDPTGNWQRVVCFTSSSRAKDTLGREEEGPSLADFLGTVL